MVYPLLVEHVVIWSQQRLLGNRATGSLNEASSALWLEYIQLEQLTCFDLLVSLPGMYREFLEFRMSSLFKKSWLSGHLKLQCDMKCVHFKSLILKGYSTPK